MDTRFSDRQKWLFALLVYCIAPISGFGIDIYSPSLPAIATAMHASGASTKLTMTTYLIALGIFQPLVGPISDSIGRRWLIIIGGLTTSLMMFLTTLAPNIATVICLRFLQGLCVSIFLVPARTIVNDIFAGERHQKAVNTMTIVWALGPIVAPYVGGYLQHTWNWQAPFYALAIYCLIMGLIALFYLKETSRHFKPYRPKQVFSSYQTVLRHPHFWYGSLILSLTYAQLVTYATLGAFLIEKQLGHSAIVFGWTGLSIGLGWFIGNMANRLLIHTAEKRRVNLCVYLGLVLAILYLLSSFILPLSVASLVLPIFLLAILGGLIFPNWFGKVMRLYTDIAATCGALMVGMIMSVTGLVTLLCTTFVPHSSLPIATLFTAFWIVIWWCNRQAAHTD
jgi:multidrug resistance protein